MLWLTSSNCDHNFVLEVELVKQSSLESPETLGIDWLFEHTESESESSDMKGNFIHMLFNFIMC